MPAAPMVRLRRTWPQRLLITFNLLLISGLLMGAGGIGYFYWRFGQLPRLELSESLDEATGPAFNVLLVGSDTRAVIDPSEAESFGTDQVTGQRADTIIILRVDPGAQRAAMLSLPRDLWVPIAGADDRDRINSAFRNGPEQLIATVREAFSIDIHHYVQVDFNGFRRLVDIVGGVPMYFPGPARDRMSGFYLDEGGCITLDGNQALAFVRARHYEYMEAGRWRTDPTGDFGRISRQQEFLRRVIREAMSGGPLDVGRVNDLIDAGVQNVQIDNNLSFNRMVQLARRFRSLDPSQIDMFTIPADNANIGGASVLTVRWDEAEPILAKFRPQPDPAAPAVPGETSVIVLNGTGRSGEAGRAAAAFQVVGFTVQGSGDAQSFGSDTTQVRYRPGQAHKAALVERYLLAGGELIEDADVTSADVVVVTGTDFRGVSAEPRPAGGEPPPPPSTESTTTTAAGATVPESQGVDPASQC